MKQLSTLIVTLAISASPLVAFADGDHDHGKKPVADAKTSAAKSPMTEGEVKKIDKDTGKITIKHGEIKNLDMPSMTMVFRVKEATMLEKLKVGDKIHFAAENLDGKLTVTQVEMPK